ncbi:hypothetical protein H7J83_17810 [Mycobacterium mantenii]|nr:hypothetical protein [Mycobacterium mantenii]
MLAWQGNDHTELTLGELQVTREPVDTRTARMDLTFSLSGRWTADGRPAGIAGTVEFRTDVFDPDSIHTLTERLRRVLVAMTNDPTRRLSSIEVLDENERARLGEWGNGSALGRSVRPVSVVGLFAAQVARTPGSSMRRPTGWRVCWPVAGWAGVGLWRCCFRGRPRRSWRSWRC